MSFFTRFLRKSHNILKDPAEDVDLLFQQIQILAKKEDDIDPNLIQDSFDINSNFKYNDALIIVDMQNDFMSLDYRFYDNQEMKPSLATGEATEIIGCISMYANAILEKDYGFVIATKDFHHPEHASFAKFGPHCVLQSPGSELVPEIESVLRSYPKLWQKRTFIAIKAFYKDYDSFGAFPYTPKSAEDRINFGDLENVGKFTGSFVPDLHEESELYRDRNSKDGWQKKYDHLLKLRERCTTARASQPGGNPELSKDCHLVSLHTLLTNDVLVNYPGKKKKFDKDKNQLFICGVLGDYCVLDTAKNAKILGYKNVYIVFNLIRSLKKQGKPILDLQAKDWVDLVEHYGFGLVCWRSHELASSGPGP
jgi:nicotinamidase-related amidase